MENNKNNKLTQAQNKINNTLDKGQQAINSVKSGVQSINDATNGIKGAISNAGELLDKVKGVKDTFLESKKIEAQTQKDLAKIQSNHRIVNRVITEEYGKQKQSMDKSSDVVDAGLATNDLDKIKLGLDAMTNVANHNPMDKLKTEMDEQLERNLSQDLDDDDFMIEI